MRVPTPAGLYDYYLGGTDNSEEERVAAESIRVRMPELFDAAWANRGFLQRAAQWLAQTEGIRQFVDLGAGLPTQSNTHQVVHKTAPDARVVYVDNDLYVVARAREILAGTPTATSIAADLRKPDLVLADADLRRLIDFNEPVGLLLVAVAHFVSDEEDPWGIVSRYMDVLPTGCYLALSHITADRQSDAAVKAIHEVYANATSRIHLRAKADVARFFTGLELVPPYGGARPEVTFVGQWGAEDPEAADSDGSRWSYCAVARKR